MNKPHRNRRNCIFKGVTVWASLIAGAVSAQTPSDSPLVIPSALPPNIVLTIDDSAAMQRAYAPDSMVPSPDTITATRRFKSSTFNPLYYNPNVLYVVPSGASASSNSFTAAFLNGFNSGRGTVDLSGGYRPFIGYDPRVNAASLPAAGFALHAVADAAALGVAVDAPGAAYYYNYSPACGDVNSDGCYSLVIVKSANPAYVIPSNGAADNGRPDCVTASGVTTCTFAQESQNFANWFSYYRTRNLATVSAAWRAMSEPSLLSFNATSGARVAWQGTDTSCNSLTGSSSCDGVNADGTSAGGLSNFLRPYDTTQRGNLQRWLRNVPASGGLSSLRTATARAGDFFALPSSQSNNAYAQDPQNASGSGNPAYACRANFHVLMAGGAWGDSGTSFCAGGSCGNKDGTNTGLPAPADSQSIFAGVTGYSARAPYRDGASDTLADIAFRYWSNDLRNDLINVLIPYTPDRTGATATDQFWSAKNDPASWQHMVNFTMGIGLARALTGGPVWNPNDPFTAINANTVWPAPTDETGKIYDLWHAAVDSRGQFFDATGNSDLANALKSALQRTIDQSNIGAAIATNSTRLTAESTLYQASFNSGDWSGRLRAIDVNRDGSLGVDQWSATPPAAASRRIFTHTGTSAIPFTTTALNAASVLSRFGNTSDGPGVPGSTADKVVNYLRGDKSNENAVTGLRPRSVLLGDIVNGDIVFAAQEDFAYAALPESIDNPATTSVVDDYRSFVAAKRCIPGGGVACDATQPSKMVYVGANDGMLHGFNAESGAEVFAYIPRGLLNQQVSVSDTRSKLALLAQNNYLANHRFFVDGSPWVGDACLTAFNSTTPQCQRWATVLVGVTGAGGKGVFALDVTVNPAYDWATSTSQGKTLASFDESRVLWDLDASSDDDLGFTMGQPVIGRLRDGEFYAMFGNGYASANGCAVLYLVRLRDGLVRKLPTTNTNSGTTCATANGLGRPSLLDSESLPGLTVGDRITDFIYAADLQGNVWRFNLTGLTPTSTWPTTNSVVRNMFQAASYGGSNCTGTVTTQAITGGIEIGRGPVNRGNGQGNANLTNTAMLYFGTGKFFQDADKATSDRQTFYALMDDLSGNATTAPQDNRCSLQQRTIDVSTRDFSSSDNTTTINYFAVNAKKGFFMDLPEGGGSSPTLPSERIVGMPVILPNRLLFASLVPNSDPCTGGGTSVIQAMDPLQGFSVRKQPGSATVARIFINGGGDGVRSISGFIKNLIAIDAGTKVYLYYGTSTGQVQKIDTTALTETGSAGRGRTSWREVTGQQAP